MVLDWYYTYLSYLVTLSIPIHYKRFDSMGYSYFITRHSAEKWARENLNPVGVGPVVIEELARDHQTDYRRFYVYYPLRAIK